MTILGFNMVREGSSRSNPSRKIMDTLDSRHHGPQSRAEQRPQVGITDVLKHACGHDRLQAFGSEACLEAMIWRRGTRCVL